MIYLAIAVKSIVAFAIISFVARPLAKTVWRYMPDGRMKRILFTSW